jgi:hypothetical protein
MKKNNKVFHALLIMFIAITISLFIVIYKSELNIALARFTNGATVTLSKSSFKIIESGYLESQSSYTQAILIIKLNDYKKIFIHSLSTKEQKENAKMLLNNSKDQFDNSRCKFGVNDKANVRKNIHTLAWVDIEQSLLYMTFDVLLPRELNQLKSKCQLLIN